MAFLTSLDIQKGERVAPEKVTVREEVLGTSQFSLLFFSWGLAYGLLDIMNYHIKVAIGVTRTQASLMAFAYYSAYLICPLAVGGPLIKRCGYRFAAVVGLLVLALGDMFMSMGADNLSFGGMCAAHLVVGCGVSILERTANAYAVQIGPRTRANLRILLAQTMAAIGTVVAPLLANATIFDPKESSTRPAADPVHPGRCLMPPPPAKGEAGDLSTVVSFYRWLGLAIAGFAVGLLVFFFRTTFIREPEVESSPELEHSKFKFWKHPLLSKKYFRLWYGVAANFLNLGCQVTVAQFFMEHMRVNSCASAKDSANYMMYAQILFAVGRLVAAGLVQIGEIPFTRRSKVLSSIFKPRYVLAVFLACAVAFTGAGIGAGGKLAVACICMVMFWESPSFPMIFESATAGLGAWTSTAESITITSISGGGILPVIMGVLSDHFGVSLSWVLVTSAFGFVFSYTLLCNIVPSFKKAIDAAHVQGHQEPVEDIETETPKTAAR